MRPVMLASLLLPLAMPVMAQGAGNLPADFYPRPKCEKPVPPGQPPEAQNQPAMQSYNAKARIFNKQAETFNACMKDYRDRAQNDINVILATVHAAVAASNQP